MRLKQHKFSLVSILFCFVFNSACSQSVTAEKDSYGIDQTNKLIVWHVPDLDASLSIGQNVSELVFDSNYKMVSSNTKLSYEQSYKVNANGTDYKLYVTKLPIIQVELDTTTLNSDKKFGANFRYFYQDKAISSAMGIRQRGNLSLTFPKKSYDIEFWNDTISKEKKDLKFEGLRDDDDLILDALYNEPLKVRAQVASELWTEMHKPYYLNEEPDAKSTYRSTYAEVFVNGRYNGVYAMSESVDRKQLKLKKNKDNVVRGELFKANSYAGGPDFKVAGEFNNAFPHYVGFRMEYPVIDYDSHWDDLAKVLDVVVNQSDANFSSNISKDIHINNAIDYYLFINTIGAVDNFGKNYYLAKYNSNEPYFFVPWDLDSSFGLVQNAEKYTVTDRTFSNNLFDRLLAVNPNEYKTKLKERWKTLRESTLAEKAIISRFENYYSEFTAHKIYEREALVWPKKTSNQDDYNYLTEWVQDKLKYLDTYVEQL
ncbi:CotH kinase family protein [Aurantibacter aestuarii]|uniref:Spore coat protein CotH n=1 Tax=Aurantibacter aestuarii TaxID=1266046 RepID=A0A2T1N6Y1_9FLAO|nr:CotH kinase family protein [Aurantibacter aestuarii]PSG87367.1 spore coat protein CotH [Aurantibacter aestuarii]